MEDLNCVICEITKKTFEVIKKVYDHHNEYVDSQEDMTSSDVGSRIIFPKYSSGDTRISEQELRFIFIEQFYAYIEEKKKANPLAPINLYYSVETPTEKNIYFQKIKAALKLMLKESLPEQI